MSLQGKTVLVVDDVPHMRELLAAVIEQEGGACIQAESEAVLLRHLRTAAPPDIILLDINLPEGSGIASVTKIRALPNLARTKICMVSGERDKSVVVTALKAGAADYIVKPIDPSILTQKLRILVGTHAEVESFHRLASAIRAHFAGLPIRSNSVVVEISEVDFVLHTNLELDERGAFAIEIPTLAGHIGHGGPFQAKILSNLRRSQDLWVVKCAFLGLHESVVSRIRKVVIAGKKLLDTPNGDAAA